jgi:hypothetical protein
MSKINGHAAKVKTKSYLVARCWLPDCFCEKEIGLQETKPPATSLNHTLPNFLRFFFVLADELRAQFGKLLFEQL